MHLGKPPKSVMVDTNVLHGNELTLSALVLRSRLFQFTTEVGGCYGRTLGAEMTHVALRRAIPYRVVVEKQSPDDFNSHVKK